MDTIMQLIYVDGDALQTVVRLIIFLFLANIISSIFASLGACLR